jgi:hypothetical protein
MAVRRQLHRTRQRGPPRLDQPSGRGASSDDSDAIVFAIFLVGPGRIEVRNAELTRGA